MASGRPCPAIAYRLASPPSGTGIRPSPRRAHMSKNHDAKKDKKKEPKKSIKEKRQEKKEKKAKGS